MLNGQNSYDRLTAAIRGTRPPANALKKLPEPSLPTPFSGPTREIVSLADFETLITGDPGTYAAYVSSTGARAVPTQRPDSPDAPSWVRGNRDYRAQVADIYAKRQRQGDNTWEDFRGDIGFSWISGKFELLNGQTRFGAQALSNRSVGYIVHIFHDAKAAENYKRTCDPRLGRSDQDCAQMVLRGRQPLVGGAKRVKEVMNAVIEYLAEESTGKRAVNATEARIDGAMYAALIEEYLIPLRWACALPGRLQAHVRAAFMLGSTKRHNASNNAAAVKIVEAVCAGECTNKQAKAVHRALFGGKWNTRKSRPAMMAKILALLS